MFGCIATHTIAVFNQVCIGLLQHRGLGGKQWLYWLSDARQSEAN